MPCIHGECSKWFTFPPQADWQKQVAAANRGKSKKWRECTSPCRYTAGQSECGGLCTAQVSVWQLLRAMCLRLSFLSLYGILSLTTYVLQPDNESDMVCLGAVFLGNICLWWVGSMEHLHAEPYQWSSSSYTGVIDWKLFRLWWKCHIFIEFTTTPTQHCVRILGHIWMVM